MHRKRKKGILAIGFIVMLIAILVMGIIVMNIVKRKKGNTEDKVMVYRITDNIMAGDKVDQSKLEKIMISREYVPADYCTDILEGESSYKIDLAKGTILSQSMVYQKSSIADDIRLHNFPYVELPDKIQMGDYIDIRITFDNGLDYVLLSKKRVEDYTLQDEENGIDNSLWLDVNEEEILMMAGAVVDASFSENSRIYAIKYKSEDQDEAVVNYPVSASVETLIESDPNITKRATKAMSEKLRQNLEKQLDESKEQSNLSDEDTGEETDDNQNNDNQNDDSESKDNDANEQSEVYENDLPENIVFYD